MALGLLNESLGVGWGGRHLRRLAVVSAAVGLFLGGLCVLNASAQETEVRVHADSRFWIKGEATTHDFTCVVERVEGTATLPPASEAETTTSRQPSRSEGQAQALVRVPVEAFDCGNSRMTADLKETLQMEAHPTIRLELVHASVVGPVVGRAGWHRIEALGTLTIAGTKRLRRIHLIGRAMGDDRYRVQGCHTLRMTYFGIEPPTKALGLIKVKNRVEVQFDLLAHASSAPSGSPFSGLSTDEPPSCPNNEP